MRLHEGAQRAIKCDTGKKAGIDTHTHTHRDKQLPLPVPPRPSVHCANTTISLTRLTDFNPYTHVPTPGFTCIRS